MMVYIEISQTSVCDLLNFGEAGNGCFCDFSPSDSFNGCFGSGSIFQYIFRVQITPEHHSHEKIPEIH